MISSPKNQFVLQEVDDLDQEPGEEEILEYAEIIGIDIEREPDLLWIARAGITAPLPADWKPVQMTDGDLYFYNFNTSESSWEHPSDEKYRQMVKEERKNLQLRNSLAKKNGRPHSVGKIPGAEASRNPTLPPPKTPVGGKLLPLGEGTTTSNPRDSRSGSRLAPLALSGVSKSMQAPIQSPARKHAKHEHAELASGKNSLSQLPETDRASYTERPKTSRGSSDRFRNTDQMSRGSKEPCTSDPVPLKMGGAKFLKTNQIGDSQVEDPPVRKKSLQKEPEIMSFSPRDSEDSSSTENSENENSEEIHIGGANILLEPTGLVSSPEKKKDSVKKQPTPTDSGGEILPKDPSNRDDNPAVQMKPLETAEVAPRNIDPEIERLKTEKEEEIRKIKERFEREKTAEERKLKTEMKNLLLEVRKEHEEECEQIRKENKDAIAKAKQELDKIKQQHKEEKRKLVVENEAELLEIKKQHDSDVAFMEAQKAKIAAEGFEKEKAALKEKFEKELSDLEADYESQLLKVRREWKEKIAQEEKKTWELQLEENQKAKDVIQNLRTQLQELSSLLASLKEETKDLIESTRITRSQELTTSVVGKKKRSSNVASSNDGLNSDSCSSGSERELPQTYTMREINSDARKEADAGFTKNIKFKDVPDNFTAAEIIQRSVLQLQEDLRKLTVKLGESSNFVHINQPETNKHFDTESFVEDFLNRKWLGFSQGRSSLFGISDECKWNSRSSLGYLNSTGGSYVFHNQLRNLKDWLKDFEKNINYGSAHLNVS